MVASSRSSLRHSVRPPLHQNGGRIEEDSILNKDDTALKTAAIITASKSLPNLKGSSNNNSNNTSPPPRSSRAPTPPRRSRINNTHSHNHKHRISTAQTTLDGFLKRDSHANAENDEQPPAKKARRMTNPQNNPDNLHNNTHIAPKQPLQSRDSPDPLNLHTAPDSLRSRAPRGGGGSETLAAAATSPTTRHAAQKPVIIADDGDGTVRNDSSSGQLAKAAEKRSLRSHDGGSRSKSELALYFPNYEQILSLEPIKPEFLAPETVVALMDDLTESPLPPVESSTPSPSRTRKQWKSSEQVSPFGNPLLELHQAEKVELAQVDEDDVLVDPLSDDIYFKAHRRHERQEKQLRNIEKERAQHEKIQLDRLLDDLQGHDWLRVMGISGITDTEKKLYEPKRDHFVREVTALIDKFRVWKEEEKRRKMEREQTLLEAATEQGEEEEEQEEEEEEEAQPSSDKSDNQSYGTPPDPNDVDAWAARQLLQEARSASSANGHTAAPRRRLVDELTRSPPKPHKQPSQKQQQPQKQREPSEEPEPKPFVSFYPKRHLRDAALSARRGGRNRSAFGRPLPDIEEHEFRLPAYILTDDVIHATERKRRRLKRESRG